MLVRGQKRYLRPGGSFKHAVNVIGKYGEDETWLSTEAESWAVAYHGIDPDNVQGIVEEGFLKDKVCRDLFARKFNSETQGFYCAPDPKTALLYALKIDYNVCYILYIPLLILSLSGCSLSCNPPMSCQSRCYPICSS